MLGQNTERNVMTAAPMDSCVVPHRSTNRAVLWLTAQIGRDAVLSESYGRRHLSSPKVGSHACVAREENEIPRANCGAVVCGINAAVVCHSRKRPALKRPRVPNQQVEQICRTKVKPQQIMATRLLHCLQ